MPQADRAAGTAWFRRQRVTQVDNGELWHGSFSRLLSRAILTVDDINDSRYVRSVIRSFRDAGTEKVFQRERSRRLPPDVQRQAHRKLLLLDAAEGLNELRVPPGNRLERLSGKRAGQHSIRINDQWRVCFRWDRGDAYDVEITDYH